MKSEKILRKQPAMTRWLGERSARLVLSGQNCSVPKVSKIKRLPDRETESQNQERLHASDPRNVRGRIVREVLADIEVYS